MSNPIQTPHWLTGEYLETSIVMPTTSYPPFSGTAAPQTVTVDNTTAAPLAGMRIVTSPYMPEGQVLLMRDELPSLLPREQPGDSAETLRQLQLLLSREIARLDETVFTLPEAAPVAPSGERAIVVGRKIR